VTRETAPEAIDKLQRQKLELEVEIHALEREKDDASKERLQVARKVIADVGEKLAPLVAAYENEKSRGDEVNKIRKRIDELKAKADEAERRYASESPSCCVAPAELFFFLDMIYPPRLTCDTMLCQTCSTV
jgi:ATP-dependent Clp protease ATP-binding subunit ClpB